MPKEKPTEDKTPNEYVEQKKKEFLEEDKPQDTEDKKKKVVEEVAEETPTKPPEETKPETKPEEKPPEVDTEELKKEVTQEVKDELVKAITGKTEEDIKAKSPWEKEGRNPRDYNEISDWAKDQALKEIETKEQAKEEKKKEETKATEAQIKKSNEQWNKYWDEQLEDLVTQGKLPKVENPDDDNDKGRVAQKELFVQMGKVNEERNIKGQPIITSIKEFFYEGYKPPGSQPAGADAPISGGKTSVNTESEGDFSYEEIHNPKTLRDVLNQDKKKQ